MEHLIIDLSPVLAALFIMWIMLGPRLCEVQTLGMQSCLWHISLTWQWVSYRQPRIHRTGTLGKVVFFCLDVINEMQSKSIIFLVLFHFAFASFFKCSHLLQAFKSQTKHKSLDRLLNLFVNWLSLVSPGSVNHIFGQINGLKLGSASSIKDVPFRNSIRVDLIQMTLDSYSIG